MSITLLALLMSSASSLTANAAPKVIPPPPQKVSVSTIGSVSCVATSIEKNVDGTFKKCILAENKTVPGVDLTCAVNSSITLTAEGKLEQCTLAVNRSYPEPTGIICADGKTIDLYPDGTLAKCTAVNETKSLLLGGTCAANKPVEFYPDGQVKLCVSNVEKAVPAANTKEVSVSEFVCAKNNVVSLYPLSGIKAKVMQCTPTESVYMRGKGTCLPGEPLTLQPDGKVQECTYTYPLYQNSSCKVESRVSFHANGSFKDCTLPNDKEVGKAMCKADAYVSYSPNGTITSCTLAAPVEKAPGSSIPAGTVVKFDEKNKIKD
jgi:hypothetical protein